MAESKDVSKLIPLLREVTFDDTLALFRQVMRFDIVNERPLAIQICLDRRHRYEKGKSKPVAYFKISQVRQLMDLATVSLAAAVVLIESQRGKIDPILIDQDLLDVSKMITWDAGFIALKGLEELEKARRE